MHYFGVSIVVSAAGLQIDAEIQTALQRAFNLYSTGAEGRFIIGFVYSQQKYTLVSSRPGIVSQAERAD